MKSNQIATVSNGIHQFKIHAHRLSRSRSAQEINKHVSYGVYKHPVENKCDFEAKDFSKSEAELGRCQGHTSDVISNVEKEMAKNPTFLQREIDTRNSNNAMVALINSFQQTVSMVRRTTEQITDVSCGNTAAPRCDRRPVPWNLGTLKKQSKRLTTPLTRSTAFLTSRRLH